MKHSMLKWLAACAIVLAGIPLTGFLLFLLYETLQDTPGLFSAFVLAFIAFWGVIYLATHDWETGALK